MAQVEALCTSTGKGERKSPAERAVFLVDHGMEGDAHAGPWHRQVSILSRDDIQEVKRKLPDIAYGDFAENIVISGLDLSGLGLGSRIRLGKDVILSITQIGKVCHAPCRIYELTGDCIMPRLGLFARVQEGAEVRRGDKAEVVEEVPRSLFQAVVITVSDTCSKGKATDTAGPAVAGLLAGKIGCHIYRAEIIPDEMEVITKRLKHYCDGHSIDLVVTVGGTGFSPRDVTPDATRTVIERPAPGLAEAMRSASAGKTPNAMLSRAVCGIRQSTLVVNLPGSRRGALENLEAILPALPHGLSKLRGDAAKCGAPDKVGTTHA